MRRDDLMDYRWTSDTIPDLTGKIAVVTGAGREPGRAIIDRLSGHGARVFAISRDDLTLDGFAGDIIPVRMNPTRMESIQKGTDRIREDVDRVDILVHAATISIAPRFRSSEGHELMLATNYLGFVMLANELAPVLRRSRSPRIVLAGTSMSPHGELKLDLLDADVDLDRQTVYIQSRLAAMLFALELNVRASPWQSPLLSTVAEIREVDPYVEAHHPARRRVSAVMSRWAHPSDDAAYCTALYASTANDVHGGQYYRPLRRARIRSEDITNRLPRTARSAELRQQLWARTEDILGTRLVLA